MGASGIFHMQKFLIGLSDQKFTVLGIFSKDYLFV